MTAGKLSWQNKMRARAFRLMGYSVPALILSIIASTLLPEYAPKVILDRTWGESVLIRGRIELPKRGFAEVPTAWVIEGVAPRPPKNGVLNIRYKTLDNDVDTKKKWNFAPIESSGIWSSTFLLKMPGGELLAYRIRAEGDVEIPSKAKLKVITDPPRGIDKLLRMIEALKYPSLALVALSLAMILFLKYTQKENA